MSLLHIPVLEICGRVSLKGNSGYRWNCSCDLANLIGRPIGDFTLNEEFILDYPFGRLKGMTRLFIYLFIWLNLQHAEVPRPGMEHQPQQ